MKPNPKTASSQREETAPGTPDNGCESESRQNNNIVKWLGMVIRLIISSPSFGVILTAVLWYALQHSEVAAKRDELEREKATLEKQVVNLQLEKNNSESEARGQIERLKEANASKDWKINELQRENSEQRIRLEGKEIRIDQLRNEIATIGTKNQQSMYAANSKSATSTNLVCVVVPKQPAHSPRNFDIDLTIADRANSSAAVQAYAAQDFSNAVKKAHMVYDRIGHTLENMIGKKVFVHRDFQSTMAPVFRIVAEECFARGDFANSVTQSWLAVCLEMPRPNPFTLALNSAALTRSSSYSIGYMTTAIHDSIMRQSDETREEYQKQVYSTLCNMGYLQITYPNRDLTSAGKIIDWQKTFGVPQPLYYRKDGQEDLWSLRWEGFGKYSEYNYTKAFEKGLLTSRKITQ